MGTRASIMIERENGNVDGIYLHWDGYPSHVLPILENYYNTREKAEALINLGGISVLYKNISTNKPHSFDKPQKDVTIAYHRDRDEDLHIFKNETVKYILKNCGAEYGYIFKLDNSWTYLQAKY